jgi:hypothetical protein
MTAAKPDMVIIFTFAHSKVALDKVQTGGRTSYDLLPAFIDGMLEGADPRATLIDGCEAGYGNFGSAQFQNFRAFFHKARRYANSPRLYDARMKIGFGQRLDYNGEWESTTPPSSNPQGTYNS